MLDMPVLQVIFDIKIMTNAFEFAVGIVGLLLLHEGLASQPSARARSRAVAFVGLAIVLVGAALLYWNAQALRKFANVLQTPPLAAKAAIQAAELEKVPPTERRELSVRVAKAEFVSGGELLDVVTEDGRLAPYPPSKEDLAARDRQLKAISEVNSRRQELIDRAQLTETASMLWLISLVIAVCSGLSAGHLRRRRS